jgi:hypothetical protein
MRPSIVYSSFKNLKDGDFVFVRLHDPGPVLVWMGKIQGDVLKDEDNENFRMVGVQWWVSMNKGTNLDE